MFHNCSVLFRELYQRLVPLNQCYSVTYSAVVNAASSCAGSLPLSLSHADYSVGGHVVTLVFETVAGSTKTESVYYNQG